MMDFRLVSRYAAKLWRFASLRMLICLIDSSASFAQEPRRQFVDPQMFGFEIPAGTVGAGGERRVDLRDAEGKQVVAKVHAESAAQLIVMLPDGTLVSRTQDEVRETKDPFVSATKDVVAAKLKEELELDGFNVKETKRYLYLYNTSEPFAVAASRIMETMFPGVLAYAEQQKIEVGEPDVPLVVVMYGTEEEFRRRTGSAEGMLAFYNPVDNRVSLYETGKLNEARPDLALQLALSTIAHEGRTKYCITSACSNG